MQKSHNQRINLYLKCVNSQNPIQRGNALLELKNFIDKASAVSWATEALDDSHHYVREHAIRILEELTGKEALPYILKILNDDHCGVRKSATAALKKLHTVSALPDFKIPEPVILKCISSFYKSHDNHIANTEVETLINLCSIKTQLLLRNDVEQVLIDASKSSCNFLRSRAARGLGKIGSERSCSRLLELIQDSDIIVASAASEVLGEISSDTTYKLLPRLVELISTSAGNFAVHAISAIQENCKYYNYEIYQVYLADQNGDRPASQTSSSLPSTVTYNIDKVGILNTGSVNIHGDQIGEQTP
jgi:HEAT repeat protein